MNAAAAPPHRRAEAAYGFAIITSVAFTTAVTESPFFSAISSALRLVITDYRLPTKLDLESVNTFLTERDST